MSAPLVTMREVSKSFPVKGGILQRVVGRVQAVDRVTIDVHPGEALGLVGESGCGKSTLGRLILRLLDPDAGTITLLGDDLARLKGDGLKAMRRHAQIIFQDPFSSLDPRTTVGDSIGEGLRVQGMQPKDRQRRIAEVLELVGLEASHANRFPHEFSGGQRQRIGIARALAVEPDLLVCDEPVSALDVSIQSQILNLLKQLQRELNLTLVLIAHDLSVVEHLCDRIAVMYLGQIVELAERAELFARPTHPYTQALLSAIPVPDPSRRRRRMILTGEIPSPLNPPPGCRFHTRCPIARPGICDVEPPEFRPRRDDERHLASCHLRTGDYLQYDPERYAPDG